MQGDILNGIYQIQQQLSKRGGRETLLAQNLNTEQLVIIKLLKFGLDAEWSDFKLFEREAQTLKNLDLAAIPNYLDYFELNLPHARGFALVQEYINAPSLEESIQNGRNFSEEEIKQVAEALLDILLYLHQRQPAIIHRDIKPSNILLSDRSGNSVGRVYLVDFGAVKNIAAAEGGTITVVGTYGYMPPEQFGGKATPASDLYSLGATLIYLATGRHPTDLPSQDGRIEFTAAVSLSPVFVSWLRQMTEPSCDRRFRSAIEALQALQKPEAIENPQLEIAKQPKFSRIILRKTPEELEVTVPAKGFVPEILFIIFFALFWNGFLVVWVGFALTAPFPINVIFPLFSIPFWTVGIGLIGSILFTFFGKTKLKITSEEISLTYECLGFKYQNPKATSRQNITAIEPIETLQKAKSNTEPSSLGVIIWANGKAYSIETSTPSKTFGPNLKYNYDPTVIEVNWLAQELSQWLNIPLHLKNSKNPSFGDRDL